ncbi:MAG: hypothetical protein GXP49_05955 [Deltaproteobacteria bacterium]|nr:hypothetical protein [Deltaproteobacteria bacterium]
MTWMRFTTVAFVVLGFALSITGCGDNNTYECTTACKRLADRWDDCNLNQKVFPGAPGSEATSSKLCIGELGTAEQDANKEASKINTCSKLSDIIYQVTCGALAKKVDAWSTPANAPKTWLDVMKNLP